MKIWIGSRADAFLSNVWDRKLSQRSERFPDNTKIDMRGCAKIGHTDERELACRPCR